jgi:hypothetical protein
MFCPSCGKENSDSATFCEGCGAQLSGLGSEAAAQARPTQMGQEGQQYQPPGGGGFPRIPNYLGWAIAVLILCFWPTGIAAVVNATRVDNRLALGDVAGAQEASRKAKQWCWISFGIAVVWVVIVIIAVAVGRSGY